MNDCAYATSVVLLLKCGDVAKCYAKVVVLMLEQTSAELLVNSKQSAQY